MDETDTHDHTTSKNHVKKILFICTQNTCRSPMAQAIAQAKLDKKFPGMFQCESAGVEMNKGERSVVSPEAATAVNDSGYGHIDPQRTQRYFKEVDIETYDKIYVLPAKRLEIVRETYPNLKDKIELYTTSSVPDPSDLEHFPDTWPHKENPDQRTPQEKQEAYNYIANKMEKSFTDKIIEKLEHEFISPQSRSMA